MLPDFLWEPASLGDPRCIQSGREPPPTRDVRQRSRWRGRLGPAVFTMIRNGGRSRLLHGGPGIRASSETAPSGDPRARVFAPRGSIEVSAVRVVMTRDERGHPRPAVV